MRVQIPLRDAILAANKEATHRVGVSVMRVGVVHDATEKLEMAVQCAEHWSTALAMLIDLSELDHWAGDNVVYDDIISTLRSTQAYILGLCEGTNYKFANVSDTSLLTGGKYVNRMLSIVSNLVYFVAMEKPRTV